LFESKHRINYPEVSMVFLRQMPGQYRTTTLENQLRGMKGEVSISKSGQIRRKGIGSEFCRYTTPLCSTSSLYFYT
jgi:hypothetical protein